MYIIKYGDEGNNIDVTSIVYNKFIKQNIIYIPDGDANRAHYFTDPVPYVVKTVFITDPEKNTIKYDHTTKVYIDLNTDKVFTNKDVVPEYIKDIRHSICTFQHIHKGSCKNLDSGAL